MRGLEKDIAMKILFFVSCLFISSALIAQDDFTIDPKTNKAIPNFAGKVVLKKGSGKAFYKLGKTGEEMLLKHGSRLKKDHIVRTEKGVFIRIKLVDDTIINLGPNSKLELENWLYKDKSDRKIVLNFLKGQLRANVKVKGKPGDIKIKTPGASMGIRGTVVLVNVRDRKDKKTVTEMALLKGKARITNKYTGKKYNLKPADHYIQFSDKSNNMLGEGLKRFDKVTYENLLAREASGDDDVPFLDFFEGEIESDSGRGPSSTSAPIYEKPTKSSGGEDSSNWKDNLNKLNQKLNEYNGD